MEEGQDVGPDAEDLAIEAEVDLARIDLAALDELFEAVLRDPAEGLADREPEDEDEEEIGRGHDHEGRSPAELGANEARDHLAYDDSEPLGNRNRGDRDGTAAGLEVVADQRVGQGNHSSYPDAGQGPEPEELGIAAGQAGEEAGQGPQQHDEGEEPLARESIGEVTDKEGDSAAQDEEDEGDVAAELDVALHVAQAQVAGDLGQVRGHQVLVREEEEVDEGEEDDAPDFLPGQRAVFLHARLLPLRIRISVP